MYASRHCAVTVSLQYAISWNGKIRAGDAMRCVTYVHSCLASSSEPEPDSEPGRASCQVNATSVYEYSAAYGRCTVQCRLPLS